MVTRECVRSGETEADGVDGVVGADGVMVGIEAATDTSAPAVRLSPKLKYSEKITDRLPDTSRLFCPANRFRSTAD